MTKAKVLYQRTADALSKGRCHRCKERLLPGERYEGREPTYSQRIGSPIAVYYYHVPTCPKPPETF